MVQVMEAMHIPLLPARPGDAIASVLAAVASQPA
jgi:hypothetical protein